MVVRRINESSYTSDYDFQTDLSEVMHSLKWVTEPEETLTSVTVITHGRTVTKIRSSRSTPSPSLPYRVPPMLPISTSRLICPSTRKAKVRP